MPLDFTPHNFRDTAASLAIQASASVIAVSRMLGHEDAATLRLHVLPYFGRKPLSGFAPSDIEAWSQHLISSVSVHTARQALVPVRQAFKLAVRDGLVHRDPTTGVLPKSRPNEPCPLTHNQIWELHDAAKSEQNSVMLVTMAYSGARWGEVSALTTASVRPGSLRLTQAYSEVSGHLILGSLKDHEARTVPLPETVSKIVEDWHGLAGGGRGRCAALCCFPLLDPVFERYRRIAGADPAA